MTVTSGDVPDSPRWTPKSTGTYYFVAFYSGDISNSAATSGCAAEPITVSVATSTPAPAETNPKGPDGASPTSPTSPPHPTSPTAPAPTRPSSPTLPSPPVTVSQSTPTLSTDLSVPSVAIGGSLFDTATLSGATDDAGGTVTYSVYDNATCSSGSGGLVTTLGPVTVNDGSVPDSPNWTATGTAGTYYFVASYSGDASNATAVSACSAEPMTVSQNAPTISTQLSATSVAIGGTAHDTALLSGAGANASGSVTYSVYDNANCTSGGGGLVTTLGPVSVSEGSVPDSPNWTAIGTAGTYYFVASYSGDANDATAVSGCGAEPISVRKNAPSISTQLSATSVAIGGAAYDTATLSGATAAASGIVTYSVYDNATCTIGGGGLIATLGPLAVTNGTIPDSPTWTPDAAGMDYFVASYSGDANNTAATTGCSTESVTVVQNAASLSTQLSVTSVAIGGSVYDTATLSGASANAGGSVTYNVYNNATCTSTGGGLISTLGPVTVTNGAVPDSPAWTPNAAGMDYFVASYSGDANNTAATTGCSTESVTVVQNAASLSTQLSVTSVAIGGSVYDTATLSGASANAGGSVTYNVYNNATCTSTGGGLISTLGPVTVTNGAVPDSPAWTPNAAGTDYFVASYSGDVNNIASASGCIAEPLTVSPSSPSITTQLSAPSVAIGGSVYDTATLSGASANAGGSVIYSVYNNATCTSGGGGLITTLGPVTVASGTVPDSPSWTATGAAGTYFFAASYSGDGNNTAASSGCGAEPIVVTQNMPTISTQLSATSVPIAGTAYDTATLSGASANAGGSVTYDVYDNATCTSTGGGLISTLGPVTVASGTVPNSPDWTATVAAGAYYFVASYSGDANNAAAVSGCSAEPITVITTSLIAGSLAINNGSGNIGRADQGDTIVVTYTNPPGLGSFCSGWTSSSHPELGGPNVVVTATETAGGDGIITSVSDSSDCAGGFHFGSIDLGQGGYFTGTVTFGGLSLGCILIIDASCSSIQWDGANTLTITLGAASVANPTQGAPSVAIYAADPSLGYTGTLSSPSAEHF